MFFAKENQDEALTIVAVPAESNMVLSSRTLRLKTGPKKDLKQTSDKRQSRGGGQKGDRERHLHPAVDVVSHKAAQNIELPVREVHNAFIRAKIKVSPKAISAYCAPEYNPLKKGTCPTATPSFPQGCKP